MDLVTLVERAFSPSRSSSPYTHRPGTFVPRADTLAACTAILDGVHDDVPEDAFYFAGGIDEVLARARGAG